MLQTGDFIALVGDLGSGKTAFARALISRLLGPDNSEEIPSPSFALLQTYETARMPVYHFDFYRLSSVDEAVELGLDDALNNGLVLAEWPDRLENELPADRLEIHFRESDDLDQRSLQVLGLGRFALRLQRFIDIDRFLFEAGWNKAFRQFLQGDASSRTYTRLSKTNDKALLMDAPRQPDGPPIRDGRPYSALAHLAEDVRPFVAISKALQKEGFSTPNIIASDLDKGLLLLEDFGDNQFGDLINRGAPMAPFYQAATRLLADLASKTPPDSLPVAHGEDYRLPFYNLEASSIELELLLDWFWPAARHEQAPDDLRAAYLKLWQEALMPVFQHSNNWVLRDFHSPNLIWLEERQGNQKVGLIDFQDAQRGHAAYDLVSLLQDARRDVPVELEQLCLELYVSLVAKQNPDFDETAFRAAYATLGAQRNTKILGIFIRLAKRDNKPAYLAHIPRVANYLTRNLQHPALADLQGWYDEHVPVDLRADPMGSQTS
ncbi:MAG: tRNA (adenosine(37)-N6)-threonylcarbamoyltransferase complex ATPase subunit type 1 TsaE [Hyphomicrobiaceae bacterium]|nr:tRNA (adenosine(37)-N6)-threonylcarbamoyltransferase complex ATPase subunit type 1 TsaE [Hyphomicrobiaceae bacterium]